MLYLVPVLVRVPRSDLAQLRAPFVQCVGCGGEMLMDEPLYPEDEDEAELWVQLTMHNRGYEVLN